MLPELPDRTPFDGRFQPASTNSQRGLEGHLRLRSTVIQSPTSMADILLETFKNVLNRFLTEQNGRTVAGWRRSGRAFVRLAHVLAIQKDPQLQKGHYVQLVPHATGSHEDLIESSRYLMELLWKLYENGIAVMDANGQVVSRRKFG